MWSPTSPRTLPSVPGPRSGEAGRNEPQRVGQRHRFDVGDEPLAARGGPRGEGEGIGLADGFRDDVAEPGSGGPPSPFGFQMRPECRELLGRRCAARGSWVAGVCCYRR